MVQSHTWQEYTQEDQGTCQKLHKHCDRCEILASNSVGKKIQLYFIHTHTKRTTLCNDK